MNKETSVHRGDLRLASHKDAGGDTDGILGRQSAFAEVEVLIPQLTIDLDGQKRSWDEARSAVIARKKTLSDAAADGYLPTQEHSSPAEFAKKALETLKGRNADSSKAN
jgi:hypothetical protein